MKALGKKIRDERIKLKLSQEQLAEKIGVHRNYVGSIERGERNISVETLIKICKVFKVSSSTLLGI